MDTKKQTKAAPTPEVVEQIVTTESPLEGIVAPVSGEFEPRLPTEDLPTVENIVLSEGEMKAIEDSWAHKPALVEDKPSVVFFNPNDFPVADDGSDSDWEGKLQIVFPNSETYRTDVFVVAAHLATATIGDGSIGSEPWLKAFNDAYEKEEVLYDWLRNQMCWGDFEDYIEPVTAKVTGYDDHANDWLRAEVSFFV